MRLCRLHPDPAEVAAEDQLSGLRLGELAPAGRPHVAVNFVLSADGRAAFRGRSAPLGSDADREVFHRLRTQVDAVLAGTGTVGTETYSRLARAPERRAQREAEGLAPDPWLVLVTRSGALPWSAPLFADPAQGVLLYAGGPIEPPEGTAARVEVRRPQPLSFAAALADARDQWGVRSVLCEGGPRVFSALLRERLVDELFLTLSPRAAGGGDDPPAAVGAVLPELAELELRWVLERDGWLFLRYGVSVEPARIDP